MIRKVDVVVVGSGPGGAVTAAELGAAGLDVLVVEEGARVHPDAHRQYSLDQMAATYRNAGLTAALGTPTIAYTEGCVVGGGSEVNSGLYHRPSADLLLQWSRSYAIDGLDAPGLLPFHGRIEDALGVHADVSPSSDSRDALRAGAEALGWQAVDVPRAARLGSTGRPERQTMSRTYLAAAERSGVEVLSETKVHRVTRHDGRATGVEMVRRTGSGLSRELVRADAVFVCGGAIQTPALLQRSGWWHNVGGNLSVHPTVKVVAELAGDVDAAAEVGTMQVREFAPWLTLGASASTQAMVALALSENWEAFGEALARWRQQVVHYAAIQTTGRGRVTAVPGRADPVVTHRLSRLDRDRLSSGLARLMHLLVAGGASRLYPVFPRASVVTGPEDVARVSAAFRPSRASLMTVHLAGTVPMGEERRRAGADSFGALHGAQRLWVNDASLLPWAPGINPQGTLMAVAHRNAARFLDQHGATS